MAGDLTIQLGVELDPAGLANIQNQIKSLSNGDNKIKLTIDAKDVESQLTSIKNLIGDLNKNPQKLKIDIDKSGMKDLENAGREIERTMSELPRKLQMTRDLQLNTGNIRNYAKELQELADTFSKLHGGKEGVLDTKSLRYDTLNDAASAVLRYKDALGETHSVMMRMNDVSLGNGKWQMVGEQISTSLRGATKEIENAENRIKQIDSLMSGLNKYSNQYGSSNYVDSLKASLSGLKEEYTNILSQLKGGNLSQDQFGALAQRANELREQLTQAASASKMFQEGFKNEQALASFRQNIDGIVQKFNEYKEAYRNLVMNEGFKMDSNTTSQMEAAAKAIENINPGNLREAQAAVEGFGNALKGLKADPTNEINKIGEKIKEIDSLLSNSKMQGFAAGKSDLFDTTGVNDITARLEQLKAEYTEIQELMKSGNWTPEEMSVLKDKAAELDNQFKQLASSVKIYQDGFKNEQSLQAFTQKVEAMKSALEQYKQKYQEMVNQDPSKASPAIENQIARLQQYLNNIDPSNIKQAEAATRELGTSMSQATTQTQTLGQALTSSFGSVGQYLSRFVSTFYLINKAVQTVKSMVNEVKSLNTSMVELSKVTTLSGDSMNNFVKQAYDTGRQLGRTGKDVIDATTTFSRAGYTLDESVELSKSALTMTNIGFDIPDMQTAASSMISIMKAFKIEAKDSMGLIDKLYNVSNKEPLDFGNITDMLVKVGGTMAQTGTSIEETMGLLTGGFATMRDTSVANGLIMISQRLRGIKEDGEAMEADFMPKLQKAFGDAGVDIEDANGELRSTYDILNDLHGVWDSLGSMQKQFLGEKAAGNRQVKVLNAIMANWDVVQDTIDKASNAMGAATEGNEKFMNSVEGRLTAFKSAFQELSINTLESDFIGGLADTGTAILNFINSIGGAAPVIKTLAGAFMAFNGIKIADSFTKFFTAIPNTFSAGGAGGLIGGIGAAIMALTVLDKISEKMSFANQLSNSKNAYQLNLSNIDTAQTKLQSINSQILELQSKGKLTFVEQQELTRLQAISGELKTQIEIEKQLAQINQNKISKDFANLMHGYQEGLTGDWFEDILTYGVQSPLSELKNWWLELNSGGLVNTLSDFWGMDFHIDKNAIDRNVNEIRHENGDLYQGLSDAEKYEAGLKNFYVYSQEANKLKKATQRDILNATKNGLMLPDSLFDERNQQMNTYFKYAGEDLLTAQSIYAGLVEQMKDVPENDITRPWIQMVKSMGAELDKAVKEYQVDFARDGNWVRNLLLQDDFDGINGIDGVADQIIQLARAGQLTGEVLSGTDGFKNFIRGCEMAGISAEEAAAHINEVYNAAQNAEKEPSTYIGARLEPYIPTLAESIGTMFGGGAIKDETTSFELLQKAMSEANSAGRVSATIWNELIARDKEFANVLKLTADGYTINTDAYYDYLEAQSKGDRVNAFKGWIDAYKRLGEAQRLQEHLRDLGGEELALTVDTSSITAEVEQWSALIRQIDAATNALARYQGAKANPNEDANFNIGKDAGDTLTEALKSGKIGTDEAKSAADYILGRGWEKRVDEEGNLVYKTFQDGLKAADKKYKRYFSNDDEKTNLLNFYSDLKKKGFGNYDKNGYFQLFDTLNNSADGEVVDLESMSKAIGLTKEVLQDLFGLANTYRPEEFKFEFPDIITDEDLAQFEKITKAEEAMQAIEQIEQRLEELNQRKGEIDKLLHGENAPQEGSEEYTGLQTELDEITTQTGKLTQAKEALEQTLEGYDLEGLDGKDGIQLLNELMETKKDLEEHGIQIPVTLLDETGAVKQLLEALGYDTSGWENKGDVPEEPMPKVYDEPLEEPDKTLEDKNKKLKEKSKEELESQGEEQWLPEGGVEGDKENLPGPSFTDSNIEAEKVEVNTGESASDVFGMPTVPDEKYDPFYDPFGMPTASDEPNEKQYQNNLPEEKPLLPSEPFKDNSIEADNVEVNTSDTTSDIFGMPTVPDEPINQAENNTLQEENPLLPAKPFGWEPPTETNVETDSAHVEAETVDNELSTPTPEQLVAQNKQHARDLSETEHMDEENPANAVFLDDNSSVPITANDPLEVTPVEQSAGGEESPWDGAVPEATGQETEDAGEIFQETTSKFGEYLDGAISASEEAERQRREKENEPHDFTEEFNRSMEEDARQREEWDQSHPGEMFPLDEILEADQAIRELQKRQMEETVGQGTPEDYTEPGVEAENKSILQQLSDLFINPAHSEEYEFGNADYNTPVPVTAETPLEVEPQGTTNQWLPEGWVAGDNTGVANASSFETTSNEVEPQEPVEVPLVAGELDTSNVPTQLDSDPVEVPSEIEEPDTSNLTTDLGGEPITIEAEVEPKTDNVDSSLSGIEGTTIEVDVNANTDGMQEQVDGAVPETEQVTIEGDASGLSEQVDGAVPESENVEITGDTGTLEGQVEAAIPDSKDITVNAVEGSGNSTPENGVVNYTIQLDSSAVDNYTPEDKTANVVYSADTTEPDGYTPADSESTVTFTADTSGPDGYTPTDKNATVNYTADTSGPDSYSPQDQSATVTYGLDSSAPDGYQPSDKSATATYGLDASAPNAYQPSDKNASVHYGVDASAINSWTPPVKKGQVVYTASGAGTHSHSGFSGGFAKGTTHAPKGASLVDEEGAELIEHVKAGTYELGTDNGPRMTHLDAGDVVHTAKETKEILSRVAKVGGFFRDGWNKTKSIIGNAFASGTKKKNEIAIITNGDTVRVIGGNNYTTAKVVGGDGYTTGVIKGGDGYTTAKVVGGSSGSSSKSSSSSSRKSSSHHSSSHSSGGSSSSSSSKKEKDPFTEWASTLFDWAEVRLERLSEKIQSFLDKATSAVKYATKNGYVNKALATIKKDLTATTKAYKIYLKQANKVAKKGGLSSDIKKKVKSGDIRISEYDEKTQARIKEYKKWYDLAVKCKKALVDLREQQTELAKQKIDNIIEYHENRINRYGDLIEQRETERELLNSQGREITSSEYTKEINYTKSQIELLETERKKAQASLNDAVKKNYIKKGSTDYYKYVSEIQKMSTEIVKARIKLIEFQDTINAIDLTNLGWELDALTNNLKNMQDFMDLHTVQAIDETVDAYKNLIDNGMDQIKNLEEQNKKYREQQEGLDVLSEKYQKIQKEINNNTHAIMQMKESQEKWNDAIIDLKIDKLKEYEKELKKTNDQYRDQKKLQDALNELEEARSQRTQRVFVDGVGFVYQADEDKIKSAQERLEDLLEDQLMSRIDDLIDALQEAKDDNNIYDASGNLLGQQYTIPQLGTLTDILSSYYSVDSVFGSMDDLKQKMLSQVLSGASNTNTTFTFGDINLSEVNDADTLAKVIVDQLPNALLQAIYKKQ